MSKRSWHTQTSPVKGSDTAFRRIDARSETLVDKTAAEIKRLIVEGQLRAGDRLPAERELVERLGVSRTVLREALGTLEALGFIERRSTRGRFVTGAEASGDRSIALVSAWLHQHAAEISEIDEVRAVIESHALRTANPDDVLGIVRRLGLVLMDQQDAVEFGHSTQAAGADTDFHKLVCSATRNKTLLELATALIDRSRQMSVAAYSIPEFAKASLREHTRVVEALAEGDTDAAARLLREHILTSSRRNVGAGDVAVPGPQEPSRQATTPARTTSAPGVGAAGSAP